MRRAGHSYAPLVALLSTLLLSGASVAMARAPNAIRLTDSPAARTTAVTALLASCPGPQPVELPDLGEGTGSGPVWLVGWGGAGAVRRSAGSVQHGRYVAPYGWRFKALWVVDSKFAKPITLRAALVGNGTPLWFEIQGERPTRAPIFDPRHPSGPREFPEWLEFRTYLYVAKTGCYELRAEWQSGGWTVRIPFVVPARASMPPASPAPATSAS